jgi:hypothetical protein
MDPYPFKTLHASVRPARVAILIDKADADWQDTCLRIIEFYSQLWGGAQNIIVPTDGTTITEHFWALLEAFDPDHVFRYHKSGEDLFLSTRERYDELLKQYLELAGDRSATSESKRNRIDKQLRSSPLPSQFDIAPTLQSEIKTRLAPFWFGHWVVNAQSITAGSLPHFELTSISKIIASTEHPDSIATVETTTEIPPLWYAAATGRLSDDALKTFAMVGVTHEFFTFTNENVHQLIEFTVNGGKEDRRLRRPGSPGYPDVGSTPFNITMTQLGLYQSTKYQSWNEPLVAVVGNTVGDFCLYYCLSRLRGRVAWVFPSVTDKALRAGEHGEKPALSNIERDFLFGLRSAVAISKSEGGLAIATVSLTSAELDAVIEMMNVETAGLFGEIKKIDGIERLIQFPLTAVERDNFQQNISLQFSGNDSISPFSTPKLKHFVSINPYEQRYITQLSILRDAPPKHFYLGTYTVNSNQLTTGHARVGKDGPAYFCPSLAYFGGDIDTILVRPKLHLPPLSNIIEALAQSQGYECRPSDKGIYADETISKFGGIDGAAKFLKNPNHRAVLDQFLTKERSTAEDGVYLSDRRRYLDFAPIEKRMGDTAKTVALLDDLVSKTILYRGFIFGCSYCRSSEWFAVGDIDREFRCRRCRRTQIYTQKNWKTGNEPPWFYKLDELIYQGHSQGMLVPLLTLNHLKNTSQDSFTFTTDREFWKPGEPKPEMEADFICVPDGVLTMGEAKAQDNLGNGTSVENAKINKYKRVVAGLSVRQLIFATTSNTWRTETIEAVKLGFRELPHVKVVFLDASHLL